MLSALLLFLVVSAIGAFDELTQSLYEPNHERNRFSDRHCRHTIRYILFYYAKAAVPEAQALTNSTLRHQGMMHTTIDPCDMAGRVFGLLPKK